MRNVDKDKGDSGHHSESSEGDRFAHFLDGLLSVPASEIEKIREAERTRKKKPRKAAK